MAPLRGRPQLAPQVIGNLLAMKAAVLDEDFVGTRPRDDHPSNVDSGDVAFERHWIADRTALLLRKFNAHAAQKIVVRVVANQSQHKVVLQAHRPAWGD